jgi:hypothetical protein
MLILSAAELQIRLNQSALQNRLNQCLFMSKCFYGTFVHGTERGDNHSDSDDYQKEDVLDGADDEEVQPEGVHPVGFLTRTRHGKALGKTDVHGKLEPDNPADDTGDKRQQGGLSP